MAGHRLIEKPSTGSRALTIAKAIRTANGSVLGSGSIFGWSSEATDTDNAYSATTGLFVVPRDMRIRTVIHVLAVEAIATSRYIGAMLHKNTVQHAIVAYDQGINSASNQLLEGEFTDNYAAGDVLDMRSFDTSSGWSLYGADGAGKWSWIEWQEVPAKAVFPATFAPVVTSLPTTGNYDGREVDFLADATNGVIWRMKYRASTTRWHFVGGPDMGASYDGSGYATSGGSYVTDSFTSITCPFTGDFELEWGAAFNRSDGTGTEIRCGAMINGSGPSANSHLAANGHYHTPLAATSTPQSVAGRAKTTITGGHVVRNCYYSPSASMNVAAPYLFMRPVRSGSGY